MEIADGSINLEEKLYGTHSNIMKIEDGVGFVKMKISPLYSYIFELK